MRQDYLSTHYLDQFISPSFCFAHSGDVFGLTTSAEIILSHFGGI